jgi:hypothetical protein
LVGDGQMISLDKDFGYFSTVDHGKKFTIILVRLAGLLLVENTVKHDHQQHDDDPQRQIFIKRVQNSLLCAKFVSYAFSNPYIIMMILK